MFVKKLEVHCSLVKEDEIPRQSKEQADSIMHDLMTLAQNTAVCATCLYHFSVSYISLLMRIFSQLVLHLINQLARLKQLCSMDAGVIP